MHIHPHYILWWLQPRFTHTPFQSLSLSLISKSQPLPLVAANKVDSIIPRHLLLTNLRFIIGLAPFVRLGAAISQNRTAPNYFCLRSIHRPLRSENKTAAVVLKTSFWNKSRFTFSEFQLPPLSCCRAMGIAQLAEVKTMIK